MTGSLTTAIWLASPLSGVGSCTGALDAPAATFGVTLGGPSVGRVTLGGPSVGRVTLEP